MGLARKIEYQLDLYISFLATFFWKQRIQNVDIVKNSLLFFLRQNPPPQNPLRKARMLARWLKIFGSILLVSWLANVALAIEQGKLGVKLNVKLYEKQNIVTFTSVVEFDKSLNPPLSDLDIVDLAAQAYNDMIAGTDDEAETRKKIKNSNMPRAITVLQGTDGRLYIASSIKNAGKGKDKSQWLLNSAHDKVHDALLACQVGDIVHRTGPNCGEPLATHLFYNENVGGDLRGAKVCIRTDQKQTNGARLSFANTSFLCQQIVTWGKEERITGIKAPCGQPPTAGQTVDPKDQNTYGCHAFVQELGLVAITIPENTVERTPRDYDPLPTTRCGDITARAPRPGDQQG